MEISRKRFIEALASGSVLLVFSGCGGGDSDDDGGAPFAPPTGGACSETISDNHGHTLAIPAADLDSTTPKSYDITGAAPHSHQVVFSVAQLQQLKAGTAVTVMSTAFPGDGHTHEVTVTCT